MLIVRSQHLDPWRNLAVEEFLFSQVAEHQHVLYLWRSRDTVVIGKNQNPWRECRLKVMGEEDAVLSRRVSGGGAVFQDPGNLNFSFFSSRASYDVSKSFEAVQAALGNWKIPAERIGRNSLMADGLKFSGSAFCFRKNVALHHGTLLISADLAKLDRYLEPTETTIRTRAIASTPAPVVNLGQIDPSVTVEAASEALVDAFKHKFHESARFADPDYPGVNQTYLLGQKYASWDWRFGMTPPFDVELSREFEWGGARATLGVHHGYIVEAAVVLRGREDQTAGAIEHALCGSTFEEDEVLNRLRTLQPSVDDKMAAELAEWFTNP